MCVAGSCRPMILSRACVLILMGALASCGHDDDRDIDLGRWLLTLQGACGGTFSGLVDDEYPCAYASQLFVLELHATGEMICRSSEGTKQVPCDHAAGGVLDFAGILRFQENELVANVVGQVTHLLETLIFKCEMDLELEPGLASQDIGVEPNQLWSPDHLELERVSWGRHLSNGGTETCGLQITDHERQ
jgi:hypothetical protein